MYVVSNFKHVLLPCNENPYQTATDIYISTSKFKKPLKHWKTQLYCNKHTHTHTSGHTKISYTVTILQESQFCNTASAPSFRGKEPQKLSYPRRSAAHNNWTPEQGKGGIMYDRKFSPWWPVITAFWNLKSRCVIPTYHGFGHPCWLHLWGKDGELWFLINMESQHSSKLKRNNVKHKHEISKKN